MNAVEMRDITKSFGSVNANRNINFCVREGEIHSLLGENGAGKTTLMNILYGIYTPTEGTILIHGNPVVIHSPLEAIANGVAMVHQHFMLVEKMTVAENVVVNYEPHRGLMFDEQAACKTVEEISSRYGLKVDARARVGDLSVGAKQRVEIIKALFHKANILILDEPTAVLTPGEVQDFFCVLQQLRAAGKSIILITHKLNETMAIADRVTVLRQGEVVATLTRDELEVNQLAEMMVGRHVNLNIARKQLRADRPVLMALENAFLIHRGIHLLDNVSLELRAGEILGIAGVSGNGQTELVEVLTGIAPLTAGSLILDGEVLTATSPEAMLSRGVGHIAEDRFQRGMVKEFSVAENLILGYHKSPKFSGRILMKRKSIHQYAEETVLEYDVRCDGVDGPLGRLSGGNQQKVVVSRVIRQNPRVIIAAQPTRGVDIGAIEFIHERLMRMRDEGKAILLVSAELDEILQLSDRIGVLYGGKLAAIGPASEFDEIRLGRLMTGQCDETSEEKSK